MTLNAINLTDLALLSARQKKAPSADSTAHPALRTLSGMRGQQSQVAMPGVRTGEAGHTASGTLQWVALGRSGSRQKQSQTQSVQCRGSSVTRKQSDRGSTVTET